MGVPKFYRWISERYPKINQVISDSALLPEFDHLYLDINGIIHGCTHPNDDLTVLSEKEMMMGVMHYLDRVIQIVKPLQTVFIAIDGVAPRAKLNQQRSRRFRSAKDLNQELQQKSIPKADVFDSNCITPGTEFLVQVSKAIQYFIRQKLKDDLLFQTINIIFSGPEVPGEGEHKIMDYIRQLKAQPGYQPNSRHCMYGQDADLIMLALVTHEPHFTLLREVINFQNFPQRNQTTRATKHTKEFDFQLLHVTILREYIQMEFQCHNSEEIIDDFVFLTFLIGNDFLPHLPLLDISDGGFDLLFGVYKSQFKHGNYLTNQGTVIPHKLETFLKVVALEEATLMKNKAEKTRKKVIPNITSYKQQYYTEKLDISTPEQLQALVKSYMEGLIWCMAYYYQGCISWNWFYPYHYGPFLSDLTDLTTMIDQVQFSLSAPLKPFVQLMACLPPASSSLLPQQYQTLMCSPTSLLSPFYPLEFQVDMNGKRNPWEGVNLLPFMDIPLLLQQIQQHCSEELLSPEELKRNCFGDTLLFTHDLSNNETILSYNREIGIPDLYNCHSSVQVYEFLKVPGFQSQLIPGTRIPFPGFPSLKVLPLENTELIPLGLNCFGSPSKYPTNVIKIKTLPQLPNLDQVADQLLGTSLYINYPMMHEAKVVAVSDSTCEIRWQHSDQKTKHVFLEHESSQFVQESQNLGEQYLTGAGIPGTGGIQIGPVLIRLKLLPLQGMKVTSKGARTKWFGQEEADVPLQLALFKSPALDPRFVEHGAITITQRFPIQSRVLLVSDQYRGCLGVVQQHPTPNQIAVKLQVVAPEPPFGMAITHSIKETYFSTWEASQKLKLHRLVFGKITGSLLVQPGKYDLGLNLKYPKQGYKLVGYTRVKTNQKQAWKLGDTLKVVGTPNDFQEDAPTLKWEYTSKALRLVAKYQQLFPQLFQALQRNPNERCYEIQTLFANPKDIIPIRKWLDGNETSKIPKTPSTTTSLPYAAIAALQRAADVRASNLQSKHATVIVPPHALYGENSTCATDLVKSFNGIKPPALGERVVNVSAPGVPFGFRGTIVSIHSLGSVEVLFDEEFLAGCALQGACSNFRGKLCLYSHLLRVSATDSLAETTTPKKNTPKEKTYKEATGPRHKGFPKGWRRETNGLDAWRTMTNSSKDPTSKIKAMLGVSTISQKSYTKTNKQKTTIKPQDCSSHINNNEIKSVLGVKSQVNQNVVNSNELKAILGVTKSSNKKKDKKGSNTNELKAILGVTKSENKRNKKSSNTNELKAILGVTKSEKKKKDETSSNSNELKAILGVTKSSKNKKDKKSSNALPVKKPFDKNELVSLGRVDQMFVPSGIKSAKEPPPKTDTSNDLTVLLGVKLEPYLTPCSIQKSTLLHPSSFPISLNASAQEYVPPPFSPPIPRQKKNFSSTPIPIPSAVVVKVKK